MKLFTVKGLDQLLIESGYIEGLSIQKDCLFYDKCNWIIGSITRKNYAMESDFGEYANIHSTTLKRIIGREYRKVFIHCLESLGIIVVNDTYSSDKFSKSYSLTKYATDLGLISTEILSSRFRKAYDNYLNERFQAVYSNPLFRKILDNLAKLNMKGNFTDYMLPIAHDIGINDFRINRYSSFYDSLKSLSLKATPSDIFKASISFEPVLSQYGRVYHLGASIPRIIRKLLVTKDGEPLYEVDMSSAQISLLVLFWLHPIRYWREHTDEFRDERNLLLNLVSSGSIYSYLVEHSEILRNMPYSDLKLQVLATLNAKNNNSNYNRELKRLFPCFMSFLNGIKKEKGHQEISHIAQYLESLVFVETYKSLPSDVFSLIIHDCILTTEENTQLVKETLVETTRNLFDWLFSSHSFEGLFKISRVTLKDEEFDNYISEKHTREMMEDLGLKTLEDLHAFFDNG